jgi:hypothetical protein
MTQQSFKIISNETTDIEVKKQAKSHFYGLTRLLNSLGHNPDLTEAILKLMETLIDAEPAQGETARDIVNNVIDAESRSQVQGYIRDLFNLWSTTFFAVDSLKATLSKDDYEHLMNGMTRDLFCTSYMLVRGEQFFNKSSDPILSHNLQLEDSETRNGWQKLALTKIMKIFGPTTPDSVSSGLKYTFQSPGLEVTHKGKKINTLIGLTPEEFLNVKVEDVHGKATLVLRRGLSSPSSLNVHVTI